MQQRNEGAPAPNESPNSVGRGSVSGLPPDTAAAVVMKLKDCPLLGARRLLVQGSNDILLLTAEPTRFLHGLGRPVEGVIVTRQSAEGSVITLSPGDAAYDALTPPAHPARELVLQADMPVGEGMRVRLLIL